MKKILVSGLLQNNEKYLPYLFKCIAQSEEYNCAGYEFNYLFLTNSTLELLEEQKQFYNIEVINKNYDEEFLNLERICRLRSLREELLDEIKKKDFEYLIMIDSDIIFNGKIIEDLVYQYDHNKYDALSTNTNPTNNPFYYDFLALIDKDGNKPFDSLLKTIKFNYTVNSSNDGESIVKVKSAFAGMYIISKKVLMEKCPSYNLTGKGDKQCEHTVFNQKLDVGIVKNINPLWLKFSDNGPKYARALQKINKNNSDNREFVSFFLYIFTLILISIYSLYYFKKYRIIAFGILSFNTLLLVNCFDEII